MIQTPNFFIGGGALATVLGPVAAVLLALAVVLVLVAPRKHILAPLLLGVFLIPAGNVVVVAGLHFMPGRILGLVGCARMLMTRQSSDKTQFYGGWTGVDRAFFSLGIITTVAVAVQWMNTSALINQLGALTSTFGMYIVLRWLIRSDEDIVSAVRILVVVAAINALCMLTERMTLTNVFGTFVGGVASSPLIREGRIRAQGAFQHAILAGTFGATLLPLCLWLWRKGKSPLLASLGSISATLMMLSSASSTALMAFGGAVLAMCLWPLRRHMRMLRWALSLTLIALHLAMKAPVWFLIARVDLVGGSASYDRANLIDTCIKHFWDWWLWGTHNTGDWGWSMWDLSDQFVSVAETGGLLALVLFVAVISRSFGRLGVARKMVAANRTDEWSFWLLGAALFSNVMAYFGVSYFDQTEYAWFVLLSVILAATASTIGPPLAATREHEASPDPNDEFALRLQAVQTTSE